MNTDGKLAVVTQQIQSGFSLIGQDPSAIRKYHEGDPILLDQAIRDFQVQKSDVSYPSTVSINFTLCHGHVTAEATFGDHRRWAFDSDFWGFGFGYASGAGVSVWGSGFIAPEEGEKMNFEIVSAQVTGGAIQMFLWRDGGPILGSFLVGAGGAGLVGGGGAGLWSRK